MNSTGPYSPRGESECREQDERTAREAAEFLDRTFYAEETSGFSRISDKPLQVRGVDTVFTLGGKGYTCDEKTTAQYRDIDTFTLELSYIDRSGKPRTGWLLDRTHVNNAWLFVWLDTDKAEVALVERDTLDRHLESLGWTHGRLLRKQARVRESFEGGGSPERLGDLRTNGIRFHYTRDKVERPINAMLSRDTYRKLAVFSRQYPTDQFAHSGKKPWRQR